MIYLFQSELFQSDLYPDTAGDTPAVTAELFQSDLFVSVPVIPE